MLVLLEHGFKVCILDNLDNSFQKAYDRMVELAGDKAGNMKFIKVGGSGGGEGAASPPLRRFDVLLHVPYACILAPCLPTCRATCATWRT